MTKFVKINRAGFPSGVLCPVVKAGERESSVRLPDGEVVTLYNAFLVEDVESRIAGVKSRKAEAEKFLQKHPKKN